jgi:hypothetical protein
LQLCGCAAGEHTFTSHGTGISTFYLPSFAQNKNTHHIQIKHSLTKPMASLIKKKVIFGKWPTCILIKNVKVQSIIMMSNLGM